MDLEIDLKQAEKFIHSDKFSQFLLNNTTFSTAVFILSAITEKVEELQNR